MPQDIRIKMCGLTRPKDVTAAADAGADYIGLVFFGPSPRNVSLGQAAELAAITPAEITKVALIVDMDDAPLDALLDAVPLDMLQLHGDESPARVADIRARTALPVMKAIGIAQAADLAQIDAYCDVADQLLIDAKPPPNAPLPGGNALTFDWTLIAGRRWSRPWMLAGGLTPDNAAEAVARTGARQLDVSSGIECARGVKDADLMRAFARAARG